MFITSKHRHSAWSPQSSVRLPVSQPNHRGSAVHDHRTESADDAPTSDAETKPGAVVAPEDSTGDITEEGDDGSTVEVVAPTTTLRDLGAFSSGFFSDEPTATTNPSTRRYGISVTDIDLDGDFEAVVAGYGGANEVWDFQDESVVDAHLHPCGP